MPASVLAVEGVAVDGLGGEVEQRGVAVVGEPLEVSSVGAAVGSEVSPPVPQAEDHQREGGEEAGHGRPGVCACLMFTSLPVA